MAIPRDIIKAMLADLHQKHLRPLGFRKSGTSWIRPFEWKQVIDVQTCKWSTSEEAKFTFSLGVSIEALHTATESPPITGPLRIYYCEVSAEIGRLSHSTEDKWWTVTANSDEVSLAAEIAAEITRYGLPWFERLDSFAAVGNELIHQKLPFKAAVAFHLAGDAKAAEAAMAQALDEANPHMFPKYQRIAIALGVTARHD